VNHGGAVPADVPGLPGAPAPPPRARPRSPRWHEWVAFGAFNVAFGSLPAGGHLGYGLAVLGAAAALGAWQYRWPRDLALRLTVPAVFVVLGAVVALVPAAGTFRLGVTNYGLTVGAVAGLVLGERLRRARRGVGHPLP
jgi:hypothetical protein